MDNLNFARPARSATIRPTQVGYVGSGDLEVMIDHAEGDETTIYVQSTTHGGERRWQQIIERLEANGPLPAMRMDIHDFSATPGVIRLRIEQALEAALAHGENHHE